MTPPSDPKVIENLVNWLVFIVGVIWAVWRRGSQNKLFATKVGEKVDESIAVRVNQMESSLKITQDLVATHTERIRESIVKDDDLRVEIKAHRKEMIEHRQEMHAFKQALDDGRETVQKFNDTIERVRAGKLSTREIAPGVTKITAEEEKKKNGE